jgi:ABC-type branched-subunit amino acid transport system substrate-binding protein
LVSTTWRTRLAALGLVIAVATTAVACGSTKSSSSATTAASGSGSGNSKIPSGAFSDHTGITSTSVRVANVSTLAVGGLFKGALVGTEAYADYVNSTGGINGRKITVDSADDNFSGAGNKQATQNALTNDFALVGGFSLQDNFGGQLLAANPGMPNVSVVLDGTTNKLPNVFSAVPLNGGWEEGSLQYFKQKFPKDVNAVGTVVSDQAPALKEWAGQKYAMEQVGYKIVYDPSVPVSQTDYTPNVIAMKNAGVKILFLSQLPQNYASAMLKDLQQQNFHPQVILGSANYSNDLVSAAGGAAAVDGALFESNASLFLGQDASTIPAVATFNKWVQKASPGFKTDLFTLYGWVSAQLFSQALKNAGSNPSRGSLLQALGKITSFSGDNIIAPNDPAAKTVGNCYLIGQVANGNYQRLDDPSVNSSTNGYRCDYKYITPPAS